MRFLDDISGRSPWLIGFAVGSGIGLFSFMTDEFPLPMKLLFAVGSGSFAALRSARRNARKRLRRQQDDALRRREAEDPAWEMPVGPDFRAEIGRRARTAERARLERRQPGARQPEPAPSGASRSEIDRRCEELERSLGSSARIF